MVLQDGAKVTLTGTPDADFEIKLQLKDNLTFSKSYCG
jgi:hypothetical protein